MFSVSFDDINWDPSVAPVPSTVTPPDLEFANEFGAFIDSEFAFPEDDFVGESRSKRSRTDGTKEPFFRSPFKQSSAQSTTANPFDLDDLLGVSEKKTVDSGENLSSDDLYDSETTSEGGYSCEDPLLEEFSHSVESWYAESATKIPASEEKFNPKHATSRDWSDFDFSAHNIFGNDKTSAPSSHGTRGAGKLKKPKNQHGLNEQKKRRKGSESSEEASISSSSSRRRRRKVDMEQLRARISNLISQKQSSSDADVKNIAEEMSVREAIITNFFHYRSNNMSDKSRWGELVSDDFTMMLPRTPYRTQPDDLSTSSSADTSSNNLLSDLISDIRTVFGIDALVNDTASVHGMVEVIRARVRAQKPELARKRAAGFALNIHLEENSLAHDESSGAFKASWHISTHGLLSAGFSSECAVDGAAKMRFDASFKLVALELDFDALSFGRQLQRHKLLDPLQLLRQNASLLGAVSPVTVANGGKVAIGARGAGGVLAPAPMSTRPSAAFMKSFGQACAAVKQASEAVAVANGTAPTSSPPSAQRVMQLMALNMQLMQTGGSGGVLLPGSGTGTSAKKGKVAPESAPSATLSTPPVTAAPTTVTSAATVSQPSKQGKKRSAPANVTEVGTASADSLDLFGLTRQQMSSVPPIVAVPSTNKNKTEVRAAVSLTPGPHPRQQQPQPSIPQTTSPLLPSSANQMQQTPTISMPQFPSSIPSSFAPEQMRNFMTMPPPPPPTQGSFSASGPSSDSILSLFPYGLPSTSHLSNSNLSLGTNVPPPPLSASQLSQMFGLLQTSTNSGSPGNSNTASTPFLGFLPPHLSSTSFLPLGSLGLNGEHLPSFCPPTLPSLARP